MVSRREAISLLYKMSQRQPQIVMNGDKNCQKSEMIKTLKDSSMLEIAEEETVKSHKTLEIREFTKRLEKITIET